MACGQTQLPDSLQMTSDDSTFVSNVVKNMKPLHYTATKTHHGVVVVLVYEKYTLVETLVDGFVEDLVELTPKGLIVYPRESDWLLWYSVASCTVILYLNPKCLPHFFFPILLSFCEGPKPQSYALITTSLG